MKIYVGTNFDIGCIYYVCVVWCGVVWCGVVWCGGWWVVGWGGVCMFCMYVCMQESRQACICLGR